MMKSKMLILWAALWYQCRQKIFRRGYAEGERVLLPRKKTERPFDFDKWWPIDGDAVRCGNTAEFRAKIQELRRAEG